MIRSPPNRQSTERVSPDGIRAPLKQRSVGLSVRWRQAPDPNPSTDHLSGPGRKKQAKNATFRPSGAGRVEGDTMACRYGVSPEVDGTNVRRAQGRPPSSTTVRL